MITPDQFILSKRWNPDLRILREVADLKWLISSGFRVHIMIIALFRKRSCTLQSLSLFPKPIFQGDPSTQFDLKLAETTLAMIGHAQPGEMIRFTAMVQKHRK